MRPSRVFIYEGYVPAGGTYMAYHIGRIMHGLYGAEVICVGTLPTEGMFSYPILFPVIDHERCAREITADDVLVCNPSFSTELFGLRLDCRTLCYVQGIRTYSVLDVFFDHYVFVSQAVRQFVSTHYGIDGPVIPAFIHTDVFHPTVDPEPTQAWALRQRKCVVLERKLNPLIYERLQRTYEELYPGESLPCEVVPFSAQEALAGRFRDNRIFLSLDAMEGFGLPMLEAMACGCAVVGWDSLGCREYARSGGNCLLARYGHFAELAKQLHLLLVDDAVALGLSAQGVRTAKEFSQARFDQAWSAELQAFVAGD